MNLTITPETTIILSGVALIVLGILIDAAQGTKGIFRPGLALVAVGFVVMFFHAWIRQQLPF